MNFFSFLLVLVLVLLLLLVLLPIFSILLSLLRRKISLDLAIRLIKRLFRGRRVEDMASNKMQIVNPYFAKTGVSQISRLEHAYMHAHKFTVCHNTSCFTTAREKPTSTCARCKLVDYCSKESVSQTSPNQYPIE